MKWVWTFQVHYALPWCVDFSNSGKHTTGLINFETFQNNSLVVYFYPPSGNHHPSVPLLPCLWSWIRGNRSIVLETGKRKIATFCLLSKTTYFNACRSTKKEDWETIGPKSFKFMSSSLWSNLVTTCHVDICLFIHHFLLHICKLS